MRIILWLLLFGWSGSVFAHRVDLNEVKISFTISSLLLHTTIGTFENVDGFVDLNMDTPSESQFSVCVEAETVEMGSDKKKQFFCDPSFFDVQSFKKICFQSKEVNSIKDGFLVLGTLQMHGVEQYIEIPFIIEDGFFVGECELNRFEYDVGKDVSQFKVSKKIVLTIQCPIPEK